MLSTSKAFWIFLPSFVALVLYLSTVQWHINGSNHPYATDVGEIQNALPRWGTIHHSGYPQYTALGSLFVTVLRLLGIAPAAGTSLFSLFFGLIAVALLALLGLEMGLAGPPASLAALTFAVCTSVWVDASLAEVHTMTLAVSLASLLFALRFGRHGRRRDILLLTLFITQAVAHQRSTIVLLPAIIVLLWPQLRTIFRYWLPILLITLLAPLTYLYLPLRARTGADWIFGAPDTWNGFWLLFFDNRAGRVFETGNGLAQWLARVQISGRLLADDLFWPLLVLGTLSLVLMLWDRNWRRVGLALLLIWIANFALTILIWRDRVVDAQLAAKLPVLIAVAIGIGYLLDRLSQRSARLGNGAALLTLLVLLFWSWQTRPFILSITSDRSVEDIIELVDRVRPFEDGRATTISTPWGRDYWGLTYAQSYRGQLQGLNLVDHNANPRDLLARGDHLLAPLVTFVVFPVEWWTDFLGSPLFLSAAAPGVIEIGTSPLYNTSNVIAGTEFDLGNGIQIHEAELQWLEDDTLQLTIYWKAAEMLDADYSVAVHLVSADPPQSTQDILDQADSSHPVGALYPTSHWRSDEIVRDEYVVHVPPQSNPTALRIGMYRSNETGEFINSPWLSLPVP